MTLLHKLRTPSTLKWASNSVDFYKIIICQSPNNPRFYRTRAIVRDGMDRDIACQISNVSIKQAQAALLDYLHCTRSLQFSDAEHMSKNSPNFLGRLLKKVSISDSDIGDSVTRWLRFHPINEFEPFFESSGLVPCQYKPLLPRDLMFLTDDDLLLENYHVLCNYGVPRNKIGKIYKEAEEVFRYEYGVLALKLRAYGELGLEQYFMVKMIVCSPYILIGDVNVDFIKSIEILSKGGRQYCWIEQHSSENTSYNWSQLHTLLNLFRKTGYNEEDLGMLLSQHPGIIFESSGEKTLSLIGFLFKFGSSMNQISQMFLQFPQFPVGKFLLNLRRCFLFLSEIDMKAVDKQNIICSHSLLLGSCSLKKTNTLLCSLNVGKKRIRNLILNNPKEMKNWVIGLKIEPLRNLGEKQKSQMLKVKFLMDLGFEENSKEMEKALKYFRGEGGELQERFDCIMQAGLDRNDVIEMVKKSPQILSQKKEALKMKIDFFINELRCPMSYLVAFPSYLSYTIERVKLRVAMNNWLKEQGTLGAVLSLCTVVACTENFFVRKYVKHHPRGLQVWQELKEKFEPFLESSGLGPCQYKPLLPRDLMFLTGDSLLLENHHVLCNYGIPRNKIEKIYKEAEEVFRYEHGVLALKLKAYEELGFEQYFMVKMIVCSPYILIGDVNVDFIKSMEILRKGGRQCCWIEQDFSENSSYNWKHLHTLLNLFMNTGYGEEDLDLLLSQHPGIIFESSGDRTLSLIGFLFKFGSSMKQICHMFLQFPQLPVGKFLLNLRGCFLFLNEIDMEAVDIQKIICSHSLLLGSCSLKKKHTLISSLNVGKARIRNLILHNPNEMKNWVMGSKLGPLPSLGEKQRMLKIKFLIDLGFEENSKEMRKALKAFLGIGSELQERFDCIMQAGLDRKDVIEMVKISPQILNQKKEVLKMKIDFCVNDLRCPVSYLAAFPAYLSYSIQRVKLRVAMHNWLIEQGTLGAVLSLSTILGCTENLFVRKYVKHHPRGLAVWQDLKEKIYS